MSAKHPILSVAALLAAFVGPLNVRAEQPTPDEMRRVAENWLTYMVAEHGDWAGGKQPRIAGVSELTAGDRLLARCYAVAPRGYIVVPALKELPPVKACSSTSDLDVTATGGFTQLLREVLDQRLTLYVDTYGSLDALQPPTGPVLFDAVNREEWARYAQPAEQFAREMSGGAMDLTEVGPLLWTYWHQRAPFNNNCPWGDGDRCLVCCVATATSQIMAFHRWPPAGVGNHTDKWNGDQSCGSTTAGADLYADFSDLYDWGNIPAACAPPINCQPAEQTAVAELCYEVGVALDVDYGACASGTQTYYARDALPKYFRYDADTIAKKDRPDHTQAQWWSLIQNEINNDRPILYRIKGHAVVCDGWRDTGGTKQYHYDYGWYDSHTTWYTLDNLYCPWAGCGLNEEYMIIGIQPRKPKNDKCANAEAVGNVTNLAYETNYATSDGNTTCMNSPDIWYLYTATCSGTAKISLAGSYYDTALAVYRDDSCSPLGKRLACVNWYCPNGAECSIYVIKDHKYLIQVGGYQQFDKGCGFLTISCQAGPPPNDDCVNAEPVGLIDNEPFDTTNATKDIYGSALTGPNIWYDFTPNFTGAASVSLCGSAYDTELAVYNGWRCNPLPPVKCTNDDFCNKQSACNITVVQGRSYLIEVGGAGGVTGQGYLSIRKGFIIVWGDDFDDYPPGGLNGQGGWGSWNNEPPHGHFQVVTENSQSEPNALGLTLFDSAVHGFQNVTAGQWVFTTYQFIPHGTQGSATRLGLLNTYQPGRGTFIWSTRLRFEPQQGLVVSEPDGGHAPLAPGVWAEIRVEIDLDNDLQSIYYNGQHLVTKSWTAGGGGGGLLNLAAVNLDAADSPYMTYYDDMALSPRVGACCVPEGTCIEMEEGDCLAAGGLWHGLGNSCAAVSCPQPPGACCFAGQPCQDLSADDCALAGGTWQGPYSACANNPCPVERAACCFPDTWCEDLTEAECAAAGGAWQPGQICQTVECTRDCNGNNIPDWEDLLNCTGEPWCSDCNDNNMIDVCEIPPLGTLNDCNSNGIPDECEPTNLPWTEDFDSYAAGSGLHGQGCWRGWDNDPRFDALVTAAQSLSPPHAVDIRGAADLVREYFGATTGRWTFKTHVFIPAAMHEKAYFILLNKYPAFENHDWSLQVEFDGTSNLVRDYPPTASLPLVRDAWVPLRVVVNLDADQQKVFYGPQRLVTLSWTGGVAPGGARNIAAVDLYANNSSSVYYDEFSLERTVRGDLNCDYAVDFGDINPFVLALTNPAGYGNAFPGCDIMNGDINEDGRVDFGDINPFVRLLTGP